MKRTYSFLFSQFIRAQKLFVLCLFIGLTIPTASFSQLMINEFSPGGTEFIEMVVVGAPCELVNIQGIIIDDNNGDFVNCPTPQALSGVGIATGFIRFTFDPLWAAVPAGTIIVLGGGGVLDTDVCDYSINIPATSTPGFFEQATAGGGMTLTPVGSNTPGNPCDSRDCVLNNGNPNYSVGNPYGFIIGDAFGGAIRLRDDGDVCQLRTPNGAYLHGIGYGTADNNGCPFAVQITGGPDNLLLPASAQFSFANLSSNDYRDVSNWVGLGATPGQANTCQNAQWIASMRTPQEDQVQSGGICNSVEPTTLLLCGPETLALTGCLSDNFSWASDDPSIATFSGPTDGSSVTIIPTPNGPGGITNIVVTITLDNTNLGGGCPAPSTTTYTYPVNIASFTPDATSVDICQNETCYNPFNDNNTIFSGGGVSFTWYDGDPDAGGTQLSNPSCLDFSAEPAPNLFVIISDGSCSSTFPITVNVVGPPTVTIPPILPPLCSNIPFFNLTIFNSVINSDPAAVIQWYNGNPNAGGSIISLPNFATPSDLNNLWVRVTVDGCISDPVMIPLMFNDPPTVTASSDVTSICAGGSVNLMATATDVTITTWDNNGGDGTFGNINATNTSYTPGPLDISNGSFILTITTSNDSNCPNTSADVTISVSAGPMAMITGQTEICSDGSASLNAGSTDATDLILWTNVAPSDGLFSVDNNNNTIYTPGPNDIANGSATVMVTVSDATGLCLAGTDMFNINILPSPTALIDIPNPTICQGEQIFVSVISSTANNGVFWDTNGDGFFDNNTSPNTFYTPGPLDGINGIVRLAVTISSNNNCPPATDFADITVIPAPEIFADGSLIICGETDINLLSFPSGSATGTSWSAIPGDGVFSDPNAQNPTYTPGPADIANGSIVFTVTSSDPSGNCMNVTDTHTTIIEMGATVMAGDDQVICEGNTVMLNAILNDPINNTITWTTNGDGVFNLINVSNPIYTPGPLDIANGSILLTATTQSNNPNCTTNGTDEVDITITPAPTVTVGSDIIICEGSIANLEAIIGGSATAFTWSTNGDGDFSNITDPNATYTPGPNDLINQSVTVTATTNNPNPSCTPGTGMIDISITNGPEVTLGNNITICQDDVVNLSASLAGSATSLTWSTSGDGFFSSITDPNASYTPGVNDLANIGTTIILTATTDDVNGSCTAGTAMLSVTLDEAPSIDLGNDLTSCGDDDVDLTAALGGSASTVFWTTDGDGFFDNDGSISPTYSPGPNDIINGSVMLIAVTDNGGGTCNPVSGQISITFSTNGDASFSYPPLGCTNGGNPTPDISPTSSGSFSVDNDGDIDATTGEFLISSAIIGDTYTITFTSTGNCPGDFSQDIMIIGPDDSSFTYPTISCSVGPNPMPTSNPATTGNFTVNNGASINPTTGELDLSTVTAGDTYIISFLTTGDCPATSASTISILAPPDAGNPIAPIMTCNAGSAVINLNSLLTNADTGGTWTDVSVTPTDGFNVDMFDPNNQAGDIYIFRYTLPANAGCSEDFSEVSIIVEAQETAILDQIMLMPCNDNNASNISTVNLNDLVLSTSVSGTWEDTDATGVNLSDLTNVDFDGITPGFYTFTYLLPATANCPQPPTFTTEIEVVSCDCPAVQNTIIASTCEGIPFIWNSIPYTIADTYTQNFPLAAASGCDSSDIIVLTVIELPTIDVGGNFIICEGEEIDLSAMLGGSADGIAWSTSGDGSFNNANITNPTYTPGPNDILNGAITFTGETTDNGMICNLATDNVIVNMLSPQNVSFVYPTNACLGGNNPQPSISPIPFGTYSVDSGASIDPTTGVLDLSTTTAGQSYIITFTSNGTCPGTATQTIDIIDTPNAGMANAPANICNENGSTINLNSLLTGADAGGTWTEVSIPQSTGFSDDQFDGNGQAAGTYTFRYTISTVDCPDDFTDVMVMVQEPLTAMVTGSSNICNNSNSNNNSLFNFSNLITAGTTNGTWDDTNSTGVDLADPTNVSFDGITAGTYVFTYTTLTNGDCPGQAYTTSILVEDCLCPSITRTESHNGCQGDNFEVTVNGVVYNEGNPSGTQTMVSFNTGCDSIVTIDLMFAMPPNAGTAAIPLAICNENGNTVDLNTLLSGADVGGTWTEVSILPSTGFSGNTFDGNGQNAGAYIFRYTVTSTNCPDASTDVFVEINEPLTAAITTSGSICNNSNNGNNATFNFSNLVTAGAANGIWTDTDGTTVNLLDPTNVSFDGITAGTYTFTYTTPANGDCPGQAYTTSILVEDCLCPSITRTESHDGCQGDNFEVTVNNVVYNEGNPTGTQTMVSFNTGCDSIVTINLMFAMPPNAGTAATPLAVCNENGNTVDLNSLLSGADAGGTWTEVSTTPSTGLSGNQFDSNGQAEGIYTFRYTVSANTCPDEFTEVMVSVEAPLTATITPSDNICNNNDGGNNATFNFTNLVTTGATNGTWDDTNSTGVNLLDPTNVSFNGITAGTYTFTYTTPANGDCPGQTYTTSILVEDCLCPSITTNETHDGCQGDNYEVTVNGIVYNEGNPTGTETLVSFDTGCDSIVNINLIFATPPNAGMAGIPATGCNDGGNLINLNSLLTGADAGGTWTEVSVIPSTGLNGNQFDPNGQTIGTYTFRYTVVSGNTCPDDFTEVMVSVAAGNTANLDLLTLVCNSTINGNITTVDFNTIITAGDAAGTWADTEMTGVDLSDLSSVDFSSIQLGTYTFTYTTTSAGNCPGQDFPIEILVRDCNCTGSEETITYSGCTGDGFSTVVNGNLYDENTPMGVEVMLNQMNCDSTIIIDLSYSPAPTIEAGDDRFACIGDPIDLTATIGGAATTATWSSTGDGNFDNDQSLNPIYTPGTTDVNNGFVSLIVLTDNGGTTCPPATDIFTINFVAALTGSISGENTVCAGESAEISFDLSGGTLYNITYSNGTTIITEEGIPDGFTVMVNPTATTTYTLESLTAIDNTCPATIPNSSVTLVVNELSTTAAVTSEFDGFGVSCNGSSDGEITVTPILGTPPFSYEWSNGSTNATTDNLGAGFYTITITDVVGCTEEVSATITEPSPVNLTSSTISPECFGDNTGVISIDTITGGSGPYAYSVGDFPLQVVNEFPVVTPSLEAGNYTVTLQDSEGCETEISVNITAPTQYIADLGRDTSILLGDSVELEVLFNFNPDTILWTSSFADGCLSCTAQYVMPTSTSIYSVFASDSTGCSTTTEVVITVDKPRRVYIPNAFSPNGDGTNDLFYISTSTEVDRITKFSIFDRWGELVFNADGTFPNDPRFGWNGELKDKSLNSAVFVYLIEVLFVDGERELYSGDVTLIR